MAPAAFCRFFRRQTGRTFTRYVQELRLSEASQLLSHTTLPITIVAAQVGFGNLAHFNRCFKSQKGMTPTQWRQRFSKPAVVADSV
jgi:transcriptional regulator GlxA family with amidase domain